jgi:uncharacterized protein (TIGR03437 family)
MRRSGRFDYRRQMKVQLRCLFLAVACTGFGATPPQPVSAPEQKTDLRSLPLSFEANQGQTDPTVKFFSRGAGYALFLTSDSAVFRLGSSRADSARAGRFPSIVRMKLAGAYPNARVSGAETLPGKVNYFIGNDPKKWTSGASTYSKVHYDQVYKGIDLVYYGTGRQLEFDFVVAPGADPRQIALEFAGAQPTLAADGSLVLTLDGAPLRFRKPMVYQTIAGKKETIAASYKLSGDRVQFALGKFDHNRALVIDPVLDYLTYLGGSNTDVVGNTTYSAGGNPTQGVAVDPAGNVYVTGYTLSPDFPLQGAIQGVNTTNAPTGFVAKLNAAGSQLIYSTYIGGSVLLDNTTTRASAIAVDGSGSAYVTGFTSAPQFPVTVGAYQTVCGALFNNVSNCPGAQSAFLTKLSPTGSLVYSTFLGHSNEIAVAVAVDSHGQAYVAGTTGDQCDSTSPANCFPTTANAVLPGSAFNHTTSPNNFNQGSAFIAVFDAAGAKLLYASLFGGDGSKAGNQHSTFGSGVAVDPSGSFYLVGTTSSNQLPVTPGAFQTTFYGNPNAGFGTSTRGFVAKFSPAGPGTSLVYTTYFGGFDKTVVSYQDAISGIAADASGNVYVSGNASYDFPATPGANNSTPCPSAGSCMNRGFLAKLNPAGSALVWATFVGTGLPGPTLSAANNISPPRLDVAGNVYVSGVAGNNTEYPLVNPLQPANGFGGVYVTEYDPTGTIMRFSTVIYDPASNGGLFNSGVDVDSQGNIYVAGYTSQSGLPVTAGGFQAAIKGSQDAFIAKINNSTPSPSVTPSGVVPLFSTVSTIQPGEWISIFGTNLASGTATWTGNFPTSLGGTSVTIDGKPAYLWYVSPTQINLQVPDDATNGSVPVVVTTAGGSKAFATVTLARFGPSFNLLSGKHVAGIIVRSDGSGAYGGGTYDIIGPAGSSFGYATVAAKAGDTVELFGVGFGPTNPAVPAGALFAGSAPTTNTVALTINNVSVAPFFAGETSAGLYQINVTIPSGLGTGDVSLQASVAGVQSPTVVISLQ